MVSVGDPLGEKGQVSAGRALMLQDRFERPELQRRFVDQEGELFPDYFFHSKDHAG
jgi:hypothetical protein